MATVLLVLLSDQPSTTSTTPSTTHPLATDFGHQESRDGDFTQGSYYVRLPDGRLQTVNYNVQGDSGFLAEVSYEGQAQYPTQPRAYTPAPTYG
ncbi:pro-resilin-like [Penaeus indicus]|uniref:pro-resilin-like n=1 Tax=Penaeus indicus TaxID=29960 RepID=UPI00300CBC5A